MKKILILLIVTFVLACSLPITVVEATYDEPITSTNEQSRAAGLILSYELSVSPSKGTLYINAVTRCSRKMESVGFKNIVIQYSTDNVNWQDEKTLGDLLKSDSIDYYLNNYSVSVNGGYHYRVICTHYAKESGWFGKSQSEDNISNSVWVNK